ncbi:MAG: phage protein Gp36 family protein [Thermonemataceae bacterium]|nr:phage protein Gp36 family protein [Thermonemataceae bacterium]
MIWLTDNDIRMQIRNTVLQQIIEQNTDLLNQAELASLSEIESYLRDKYNVAAIWASQAEERNALLVVYAVDILLYHLHSRINPNQIPDLRIKRYDDAIAYLKAIAKGSISIQLPLQESSSYTDKFGIGSNARRKN